MPLAVSLDHVPPAYREEDPSRLFAAWQALIAAQNYPGGMDRYEPVYQANACKKLLTSPSKVLFLGCGDGSEVKVAVDLGHDAWGVTLNPNNIVRARNELGLGNVYMLDGHIMPLEWGGSFDAVMGFQYLEHSPCPMLQILEVARVLKAGGICYFETPGDEGWTLDANPHHYQCPTSFQAKGWLMKAGFRDIDVVEIGPRDGARHLSIFGRLP